MARSGPKSRTNRNSRRRQASLAGGLWDGFEPPADLDDVARLEFARLKSALASRGTLDRTDPRFVCMAAELHALIVRAEGELGRGPLVLQARNGIAMPHPMLKVIANLGTRLRGLLNDMGLTPKSAKHAPANPPAGDNGGWDGLLSFVGRDD